MQPKTITFTHRSPTFVIRSHQAPFPFTSNLTIAYILKAGEKLFRTAIGAGQSTERITNETTIGPYSNLQLSFSGLEKLEGGQRGIEGFFSAAATAESTSGATRASKAASVPPKEESGGDRRAASNPPAKRGVGSLFPATSASAKDKAKATSKKRKPESSRNSPALVSLGNNADGTEEMILASSSDEEVRIEQPPQPQPPKKKRKKLLLPTSRCEICQKLVGVADDVRLAAEKEGKVDSDKAARGLERAQSEHTDWHVARELLGESWPDPPLPNGSTSNTVCLLGAEQERKAGGWSTTSSTNGKSASKKRKLAGDVSTSSSSSHKAGKKEGEGRSKANKSKGTLNGFVSRG